METNHGKIVEKVIRREGHSISEISRLMKVNRRSVYNWFSQPQLRSEIIYRIGCITKHDFSVELPSIFSKKDFDFQSQEFSEPFSMENHHDDSEYWKNKYDKLLKSYNLIKQDKLFVAI